MARRAAPKKWAELTEESIRCRVGGHIWRPYNAQKVKTAFETDEVCERCTSHRISTISNRGEVLDRKIRYADGFLTSDGRLERDDRNDMRLTVITWDYRL